MNLIKKGTVFVWCDLQTNEVKEYFVATKDFDLDSCYRAGKSKIRIEGAWGFRISDNNFYESSNHWVVDRIATEDERRFFYNWMESKGHKFNKNTLNIIRNFL